MYSPPVLASNPSVVAPELPPGSSSTGTSFYIQQRTSLFARVAASCSAAGITFQALSGLHVFEAESAFEICVKHLHDRPAPLTGRVPGVEQELERLVLDCLAKEAAERPASARELLERLEQCPSSKAWTRAQAQAWWNEQRSLLRGEAKTMATDPTGPAAAHVSPQLP